MKEKITVNVEVNVSIEDTWTSFIEEDSIMLWNHASDDWHCPWAKNDFKVNGTFTYRMEARDGSFGFDFGGKYLEIDDKKKIVFELGDGRKVEVRFIQNGKKTKIIETFDAEGENSLELQKNGWQAILDNFKKYTEDRSKN